MDRDGNFLKHNRDFREKCLIEENGGLEVSIILPFSGVRKVAFSLLCLFCRKKGRSGMVGQNQPNQQPRQYRLNMKLYELPILNARERHIANVFFGIQKSAYKLL